MAAGVLQLFMQLQALGVRAVTGAASSGSALVGERESGFVCAWLGRCCSIGHRETLKTSCDSRLGMFMCLLVESGV